MRKYQVKTKVKENYNVQNGNELIVFEKGEEVVLNRDNYEYLYSMGKVEKGQIIEEKK